MDDDLENLIDEQFGGDDADDFDPDSIEEGMDIDLGEAGRNWERPALAADFNPNTTNLGTLNLSSLVIFAAQFQKT